MPEKRKIHWTSHLIVAMLICFPIYWLTLVNGPVMKLFSIIVLLLGVKTGIILYTGRQWNLGEAVDDKLLRMMERRGGKKHE